MKEFLVLRILDLFQGFYKKLGVDYKIMRMVVQMKLTMDGRRVSTVMNNNKKNKEKAEKNNYLSLLLFNLFLSIFMAIIMMSGMSALKSVNIVTGVSMFMMISLMISDFSAVLLDVTEKNILLSKPIDDKTFNAAKTTHIALYIMGLALSLNVAPLILGTIKYGIIFFIIFIIENILLALIVVVITALLYTVVLKFFDGEKLKDIINYFQILLAFILSFGYQLFNRFFTFEFGKTDYVTKIWHAFIPSMWFAAPFGILMDKEKNSFLIFLCVMAIVAPILLIIFYVKKIVPYFEKNLQKLNNNGEATKGKSKIRKDFIGEIICRDNVEKSMFRFTKNMIFTERNFKLKVYPSLAMAAFLPILFSFTDSSKSFIENVRSGMGGKMHLLIYISIILLCFSTAYINNSDNYKGAFIYQVLPISNPGVILKGAIKSILINLITPIYLLMSLLFLIIKGPSIVLDLIVIYLILVIVALTYFKLSNKVMPFSVKFSGGESGKLIFPGILSTIIIGVLALIHILIRNNIIFVGLMALALCVINIILWKISFKLTWKDIKN